MRSSNVEIASPCHESWDAMSGEGARRFCGVCQKDVHNLSAMGHDEAKQLLKESAGQHLCVRYTAEADGTLRFRDLVPRASQTRKIVRAAFATTMLAACTPHGEGPAVSDLGEQIIESIRERTVPTADGGCDYTTGPFTTFHLPAGHVLCKDADRLDVQPIEALPMVMGAMMPSEPQQVTPPPQPIEKMGEAVAVPEKIEPFVPCDPKPGYAPPPPVAPGGEKQGDVAPKPPPPSPGSRELMGDPFVDPEPPGEELMGKIAAPQD